MDKKISKEAIKHIAELSMLELSDEEEKDTKENIDKFFDYLNILNELDTGGDIERPHVDPAHNILREDIVINFQDRDNIISNAPENKDGYFKIPFIS